MYPGASVSGFYFAHPRGPLLRRRLHHPRPGRELRGPQGNAAARGRALAVAQPGVRSGLSGTCNRPWYGKCPGDDAPPNLVRNFSCLRLTRFEPPKVKKDFHLDARSEAWSPRAACAGAWLSMPEMRSYCFISLQACS